MFMFSPRFGAIAALSAFYAASAVPVKHVLLISVDGFHALDLENYVVAHPNSALAKLAGTGTTYTAASCSKPSDSFPGLMALITGGTPVSTGVYYDNAYDRSLCPPGMPNCAVKGTEVVYDEGVDVNPDTITGGGGLDTTLLPLDPAHGNAVVYPHQYLRVNTIFEVAKAANLRTAWSDKHQAYEIANGPSGHGVDDLYTPEINSAGHIDLSAAKVEAYDSLKVQALLHEIDGKDHTGTTNNPMPAVFGMNFQAVSVSQKVYGYIDQWGTPADSLAHAMNFVDRSLGKLVAELKAMGKYDSTVIIITAKHGQGPIDPMKRTLVDDKLIPALIAKLDTTLLLKDTQDDIALLWVRDSSKIGAVSDSLRAHSSELHIADIYSGERLKLFFANPRVDKRAPDIIVVPTEGVIYTKPTSYKMAEHGGFNPDDINVPILLSNGAWTGRILKTPVITAQVAPTLLKFLGLDPQALQAVKMEKTQILPGFDTTSMSPASIRKAHDGELKIFTSQETLLDALGREARLKRRQSGKGYPVMPLFARPNP